ncbi:transposase [Microvirga aerophila]|uniref:transposase n=1 Tax=Microvirga aerophila TaxID=670291 RepID=UPI001FE032D8|nr:transposase [Microvirga aerophila]
MGGTQKKAQREHRTLLLWNETGHSFRARPGTTWARRGIAPVLQRVSKRREVSSIVAITPDGRLYARHFRTSISSEIVISALRSFRRRIGTPLLVVWDRLNAHRSKLTSAFIAAHPQDFAVAYLPAYAPELNPEEQCNAFVKRAMENALPRSVADLHRVARREFARLQRRPEMIVSFFRHAVSRLQDFREDH